MTTTPLPSYGIWTTDMEGKRVMGFTPEQFLSVWQARADLEAENKRLRGALEFYGSSCDATETTPCGYEGALCCKVARAALEGTK